MKVLLVEDEKKIVNFVKKGLREHGFTVDACENGDDACAVLDASAESYDVAILDIMVPGRDGLSILKHVRRNGRSLPVILLTARSELEDRIEGLNLGADDYLTKPFFVEELVARIHAVTRRQAGHPDNVLTAGGVRLDRLKRELTVAGQTVELTTREFNLLEYLMRSPGRVLTRTQILEHVWSYDFDPSTNLVDVCIRRIRKKIDQPGEDSPIETVRGVGYRYKG